MLLGEEVSPSDALQSSREHTQGHHRTISMWLLAWARARLVLSSTALGIIKGSGQRIAAQSNTQTALSYSAFQDRRGNHALGHNQFLSVVFQ
jgi:hypothetical protein